MTEDSYYVMRDAGGLIHKFVIRKNNNNGDVNFLHIDPFTQKLYEADLDNFFLIDHHGLNNILGEDHYQSRAVAVISFLRRINFQILVSPIGYLKLPIQEKHNLINTFFINHLTIWDKIYDYDFTIGLWSEVFDEFWEDLKIIWV